MKNGKKLKRFMKEKLTIMSLNPNNWLYIKDESNNFTIYNVNTGEIKKIDK